jgi:hypothetical protein
MGPQGDHSNVTVNKFDGIKVLQGDGRTLLSKYFPKFVDSLKDGSVVLIDGRSYILAFLVGLFFLLTLVPLAAAVRMFAENGLSSWEDFLFLLVVLVCLAYISLYSWGLGHTFRQLSSGCVCLVFFDDRVVWAEKWLGHFETETFLYDEIAQISHSYINGGGDVGRGLYIDHRLLWTSTRDAGLAQHLYWLVRIQAAGREIVFVDVDDR